jgi:hypothetical protein
MRGWPIAAHRATGAAVGSICWPRCWPFSLIVPRSPSAMRFPTPESHPGWFQLRSARRPLGWSGWAGCPPGGERGRAVQGVPGPKLAAEGRVPEWLGRVISKNIGYIFFNFGHYTLLKLRGYVGLARVCAGASTCVRVRGFVICCDIGLGAAGNVGRGFGAMVGRQRYRGDWPGMTDKTHRQLEKLRNLQTAIDIRDNPGNGSPATDTTRLEAIRRIDPKGCNRGLRKVVPATGGVKAGYVIRLPATDPPLIDGEAEPQD